MRDWIARRLANLALRLGTKHYRDFVSGSITYGLNAAARDAELARDPELRIVVGRLIWERIVGLYGEVDSEDNKAHWRHWRDLYLEVADLVIGVVLERQRYAATWLTEDLKPVEQYPRKRGPQPTDALWDVWTQIFHAISESDLQRPVEHRARFMERVDTAERVWGVVEPLLRGGESWCRVPECHGHPRELAEEGSRG